jgi:hypothetical protein
MIEIDVSPIPTNIGAAVESTAAHFGLQITSDGKLGKFPGSRHWHLKRPKSTGTLELTYWPQQERFWVTYHSNRIGDGWVAEIAPQFAAHLSECP